MMIKPLSKEEVEALADKIAKTYSNPLQQSLIKYGVREVLKALKLVSKTNG